MKCRSCGFENMKASVVCARCGARLAWKGAARKKDFIPGRGGNGLLRRLAFRFAHLRKRFSGTVAASPFAVLGRIPRENMRRVFASIIPGIGDATAGGNRRALLVFAAWALAIAMTALFAWMKSRNALFGAGIAAYLHSRAVVEAARLAEFCRSPREGRLLALLLAMGVFAAYALAAYLIFRDMTFTPYRIFRFGRRRYGWWW